MNELRCFNCGCSFNGSRSNQLFCSPKCRYKYNKNEYLILTLKKLWFDMIKEGVKLEEYREIKPYWTKRFENFFGCYYNTNEEKDIDGNIPEYIWSKQNKIIEFRNGYGNNVPKFLAECVISEGYGRKEWGAEPKTKYYILTIKRIL